MRASIIDEKIMAKM